MRYIAVLAATVFVYACTDYSAFAESPLGVWVRPSTGTKIKFYSCGGKLCAKIVSVKDPARRKTVGTVIMNGSKKIGPNTWEGQILNTDNGKHYSGQATFMGNSLKLQGCILGNIICSGETWHRAN